ncbi:hypothetical protein AB0F43_19355 [Kribbella sp. NPDC023972]|uniref:hypothetical protein n=1 Tax=Kribbella sp. NPDC023972 TaxID=3154795 RepID=UPI0034023B92
MRIADRAARLAAQISLLLALASTSAFLVARGYVDNDEQLYNNGRITEVVPQGTSVTVGDVEWKLDSLEAYTRLVGTEGKEITSLTKPAGSMIVMAKVTVTPRDGVRMEENGFTCDAKLHDDRGNVWENQQVYTDFPLPTYCTDDEFPFTRNKSRQVAQLFVVPASAVPHLNGIMVGDLSERRIALLTP